MLHPAIRKALVLALPPAAALIAGTGALAAAPAASPAPTPPQGLPRTHSEITVDGELSDPGWENALVIDRFYETSPGDNTEPKVKTVALLTYDDRYFYIGIRADDPQPQKIRAPYVDRDQVIGTDDNIAILLDTRNDHRTAFELRVNPRGIQADGTFNDASGNEDFSPDFFYDTAARITAAGWQAEYRIPLTSLRYPRTDPQTWGILIWRNYPRDFRYAFHSAPIARGSNCFICHTHELTGITGLPSSHHLVAAPYASGSQVGHLANRQDLDSGLVNDDPKARGGIDVKWNPTADSAIDATFKPDFSQIESDVPQITTNQRFALFFPEKRPFFLEGVDLFDTPIQAVYTRTITDPQWGLRATGKLGGDSYTLLVSRDNGGGLVTLPGPTFSDFAPQNFRSTVAIARLRRDFGVSYGGLLFTDREVAGGGHNRVLGPDFQWRPSESDALTVQYLYSDTENPDLPELSPAFDGGKASSHAAHLTWDHQTRGHDWRLRFNDYGDAFRADAGFVPQNGFREGVVSGGLRFYPEGLLRFLRVYAGTDLQRDREDRSLGHDHFAGAFGIGSRNLNAQLEFNDNQVRVGERLLDQKYFFYFFQFDPSRRIPRILLQGRFGDKIDFDNGREGRGPTITLQATVRPNDHLQLVADVTRDWLDERAASGRAGRLYTARVERLKAIYVFSARQLVRVIGQYVETTFDPALYTFPVPKRSGSFLGSVLYSFKLNWQTVFFLGYGDNRILTENAGLARSDRTLFLKISYAIQR